ncbi:NfeD family protein [Oceanivirga salmonicida]|uniref:NfeD family protein n=1 Tax=Oceanivirga salmonicida TaxID=1769291 RepID=UPI000830921F|nr:hypothetical protein [Oceanivirga salmonicida]
MITIFWAVIAVIFLIIELIKSVFIGLSISISAFIVMVVSVITPNKFIQIAIFILLTLIINIIIKKYVNKKFKNKKGDENEKFN